MDHLKPVPWSVDLERSYCIDISVQALVVQGVHAVGSWLYEGVEQGHMAGGGGGGVSGGGGVRGESCVSNHADVQLAKTLSGLVLVAHGGTVDSRT